MDEDTIETIRQEIHPPSKDVLNAQLKDPLGTLPPAMLKQFQRQRRIAALWKIVIGVGIPTLIYIIDDILFPNVHRDTISNPQTAGGQLVLLFLVPFLIIRGVYELMMINQNIARQQRTRLLLLHPELRTPEVPSKANKLRSWLTKVR